MTMTVPTVTITAVGGYRYPTNKRRVFSNVTQHPVNQAYDFTNIDANIIIIDRVEYRLFESSESRD